MELIPELRDILMLELDALDFIMMKLINKNWRSIIVQKEYFAIKMAKKKYSNLCIVAACKGQLEILRWTRKNGCIWCPSTCAFAAKGGYLEVLKWARENACDWDK